MGRRPTKKPVSGSPPWSVRQTSSNQGRLQGRTSRDQGRVTWNPRASQPGSNGEPTGVQRRVDQGPGAGQPGFNSEPTGVGGQANRGWRASKQGSKGEPIEVQGQANTDLKRRKWGLTAKYEGVYGENHRPHAPCCFLGVDSAALVTSLADRYLILGRLVCHCLRSLPPLLIPCTKRSRSLTYHQIAKPFWSRANLRTSWAQSFTYVLFKGSILMGASSSSGSGAACSL